MGRFSAWLFNFMQGRYGFDELGRHLGIDFVVLVIVSVVLGVIAQLLFDLTPLLRLGAFLSILSILVNWGSIALLIWMFFRVLSRNLEKRRAENERFLERRARRGRRREAKGGRRRSSGDSCGAGSRAADAGAPHGAAEGYEYLSCPFCGQRMRVPRGKGKLAVKCPSCGEKTIVNSWNLDMSKNDYREHPRTGVTPEPGAAQDRPTRVDPSVLTDDREDADLLVFEKTWGHRMLAGLGYAMIVVGIVLIVYCAIRLSGFVSLMTGENAMLTVGLMVYGAGLVAGVLVIPPAIVALWVARKPRHATVAVVLAAIGIVLVVIFIGYALFMGATVFSAVLYGALFAILPVLYLIAAVKVKRS